MDSIKLDIVPVPKPRMTQADRWRSRPCTARYWEFKDELIRLWGDRPLPEQIGLVFVLPMPSSWSNKKRALMDGQPHKSKPDTSNLLKAFEDCLYEDDSCIWNIAATKLWGEKGSIEVRELI